jgi:hypothetical protein
MRDYYKKTEMVECYESRNKLEALNNFNLLLLDKLSEGVFIFKGGREAEQIQSMYCNQSLRKTLLPSQLFNTKLETLY